MIPDIKELNFPEYASLSQATCSLNDMDEMTVTTRIEIDGDIKPDFSYDWEIEFLGERYIQPLRSPQALKDNTSICSKIDLVFYHKTIYELKRHFFVELASLESGTPIADKYIASLGLSLEDFIVAYQNVLDYYYGGAIKIELFPADYSKERLYINISYSRMWAVLQEMSKVYGVRYNIVGDTIKVGFPAKEISHIFGYGYDKGLLSIERQVQSSDIKNKLLGRGGSQNLPTYYFKNASEGSPYPSDPDAIPELANIVFTELRGKTFRDYIKGWKAAHYNGEPMEHPTEEYLKGFTDVEFDPIEYVKDDESIAKYGVLDDGLDNNEEIYPSIQNFVDDKIGLVNEVVEVEQVLSDEVNEGVEITTINQLEFDYTQTGNDIYMYPTNHYVYSQFEIPSGYVGYLDLKMPVASPKFSSWGVSYLKGKPMPSDYYKISYSYEITNVETGEKVENLNILAGKYKLTITCVSLLLKPYPGVLESNEYYGNISFSDASANVAINKELDSSTEYWKPTFDIWIKNIWGTSKKGEDETDAAYSERVWLPILGSDGQEAEITFTTGWLAQSTDWQFKIKGRPQYDTSKTLNGVKSHWRITLIKSEAELDSIGLYIPNAKTNGNGKAGDNFFFTGIEMPQQYVEWAEARLDDYKYNQLDALKDIQPTWVSKIDKVRINNLEEGDKELLADALQVGAVINLADKRFIDTNVSLHIKTLNYIYNEDMRPNIEIVLDDNWDIVPTTIERIQGEIETLNRQLVSEKRIAQMIHNICNAIFLHKDGMADTSSSETTFNQSVKSGNFRQGGLGGAGWGLYKDNHGNSVLEIDRMFCRQDFNVNEFVVNQTTYIGGKQITSAAAIECNGVEELSNSYKCYFDTKGGTLKNLFALNDIAYSEVFNFTPPMPSLVTFEAPFEISNGDGFTLSVNNIGFKFSDIALQGTILEGDILEFDLNNKELIWQGQAYASTISYTDGTDADVEYTSPAQPYYELKYYKRVVIGIGENYILLSKSNANGSGVPTAGDVIIHYGNTSDTNRQYVIIRDVIGGGYERMLSGLDSVNTDGKEYYFAGRQDGQEPRWFIGDLNEEYAEWRDGRFTIVGKLGVRNVRGEDEYSEIERCLITGELIAGDRGGEHLRLNDEGLQFIDYNYAQEDENGNTIQGTEVFGGFYYKEDDYGQPYLSLTLGRFQPEGERQPRKIELTYQEISLQNEENRLFCTLTAEALTFVDTPAESQTTKLTAKGLTTDFIEYQGYEVHIAKAGAYKGCLVVDIQE